MKSVYCAVRSLRFVFKRLNVKWSDRISKEELCQTTKDTPIEGKSGKNGVGLATDYVKHKAQQKDTHWTATLRVEEKWVDQEQLGKE